MLAPGTDQQVVFPICVPRICRSSVFIFVIDMNHFRSKSQRSLPL